MNRTQFLSLFAIPFLPKADLPEPIYRNKKQVGLIRTSSIADKTHYRKGVLVWNSDKTRVEWIDILP